ncbi:MAG: hypothetical protein LBN23_02625 [Paludibacter sp.]|jgi:hypothetical protein|nr:hypothetical protein [Paludibacter sp.]
MKLFINTLFILTLCCLSCENQRVDFPDDISDINVNVSDTAVIDTIDNHIPVNIILRDKDTATIQSYIQGKWNLVYSCGGDFVFEENYFEEGFTTEFTADRKMIRVRTDYNLHDTVFYNWLKIFYNTDSIYVLTSYRQFSVIKYYVIEGIYNDTLRYHDTKGIGGYTYCLTNHINK